MPKFCLDGQKQACYADCRRKPFTVEAPPIGKIHQFSKNVATFNPLMRFGYPLQLEYP